MKCVTLVEYIRVDVELQDPQDLQHGMRLARAYEHRNAVLLPALSAPQRPVRRAPAALSVLASTNGSPSSAPTPPMSAVRPFKRLTPEEMAERRKLSLCYNCDEQFVRRHYLEVPDYIMEEPDEPDEDSPTEQPLFDQEKPVISLSAVTGIWACDSMQLRVTIGAHNFTALLDTGSTHNFINPDAASYAGLQFNDSNGAHVIIANGDRVACQGLTRGVPLLIDNEHFTVDCFSILLAPYHMVLGLTWLRALGPILWDFTTLWMAFTLLGRRVVWTGVGAPCTTPSMALSTANLYTDGAKHALLEQLLDAYQEVFVEPEGLPWLEPATIGFI